MTFARETNPTEFVKITAEELKKVMKQPEWALYVKTSAGRERPPLQEDWWFWRAASLLRRISLDGPVGVSRLRSYYGGLHRRGHKPAHFKKSGGKIIRAILQDLEKAGYVQKVDKPKRGRKISPQGQKFLNSIAKTIK